jgi:aerobic-type carbon monoxide dehydrogenase small subunit (CoxS/CutS family)
VTDPEKWVEVSARVNGVDVRERVDARLTAADFLRDTLGLRGTRLGCEHGVCGACTIQVDGTTTRACLMFAGQLDGRAVTTVEGLECASGEMHPLQGAFTRNHALQCGFCTAGFLMTAHEFLRERTGVDEAEVREAISGNLCRCTGYQGIVDAVLEADRTWQR